MTPRTRATSSAETAARYHVAKHSGPRTIAPPVYATDSIAIPRRKRRVLLDLAPASAEWLLDAIRHSKQAHPLTACPIERGERDALERMLVEALEKTR